MKPPPPLAGNLEYTVMLALWQLRSATARDIHSRIGEPAALAYTTTATVLERLRAKGLVSRRRMGKTFVYQPRMAREPVELARAHDALGRLLGPDPGPVIATLVDAVESLDPELLDDLARAVAARRKARHGS